VIRKAGLYSPKPYPDELLYSVLARFARHLGVHSAKKVLELLFETKTLVATADLQGRLVRLAWMFEERWGVTVEDAAWQYTLLPFYTAYRSNEDRKHAVAALVSDHAHSLHVYLGINAGRIAVPETLRTCPDCVRADVRQFGETYWHRVHQLPGVIVCPKHGTELIKTCVPMRPRGRHEYVAALPEQGLEVSGAGKPPEFDREMACRIAKYCQSILEIGPSELPNSSQAMLVKQLARRGYGVRHGSLKRLERDFVDYYGESLLLRIEPDYMGDRKIAWVRKIRHKRRRLLNPLRHVLLELFVENREVTVEHKAFGEGPWPCKNWLADHFRKTVVEKMEIFRDKRHPERVLGRFRCSCGFVYSQSSKDQDSDKPLDIIEFGPLFIKEAADLWSRGYKVGAIARTLDVDWKTAQRFIRLEQQGDDYAGNSVQLSSDRTQWRELVQMNSDFGVKWIRKLAPALYARLYRSDRAWLQENSPRRSKPVATKPRVDWMERDCSVYKEVSCAVEHILAVRPPKRVTINSIAGRLGCRALFQKHLRDLPGTNALLQRVCESPQCFRLRRLRIAYHQSPHPVSRSKLLRKANIRAAYVDEEVLEEIRRLETQGRDEIPDHYERIVAAR